MDNQYSAGVSDEAGNGRTTVARLGDELAECRAAIRELWAVVVEQDLELERLRERVQQARPARLKRVSRD